MQQQMTQPEPYVDARAAAAFLGMSNVQVRRLAEAGRIPGRQYGLGRRKFWRFRLSEIAGDVNSTHSPVPQR